MNLITSSETTGNHLAMAWIDLSYVKKNLIFGRKYSKEILSCLNGQINFGSLTALMGPSGAGKTTLLNCINMRIKPNELTPESELWVNKYVPLKTCFIAQDQNEHLLMGLTVRESLMFASKIKNRLRKSNSKAKGVSAQTGISRLDPESVELSPKSSKLRDSQIKKCENSSTNNKAYEFYDKSNEFDHQKICDRILSELLLNDCAANLVNDCSSGEQKRLSIGLELVAAVNNPNLMCIDEPTSGLDSNSAELVILCLNELSRKHSIAIVTSIHQPNSLLMSMFDQLYVLSKGKCVYSGRPDHLRSHLQSHDITIEQENMPIEVLLKISSTQTENNRRMSRKASNNSLIAGESEQSGDQNNIDVERLVNMNKQNKILIENDCNKSGKRLQTALTNGKQSLNFYHFYLLLFRDMTRFAAYQWKFELSLCVISIIVALIIIPLFGTDVGSDDGCFALTRQEPNETTQYENSHNIFEKVYYDPISLLDQESRITLNISCQFFSLTFIMMLTLSYMVLTYPIEVKVFLIEHHNNWYSTSSYFLSKTFREIPILFIMCVIFSLIIYYGTGQIDDRNWRFIYYFAIMALGQLTASSIGIFFGIIFARNFQLATVSSVSFFLVIGLFSGFFVPFKSLNKLVRDVCNLSFLKQSLEAILITLYGYNRCEPNQLQLVLFKADLDQTSLQSYFWWLFGHFIVLRVFALIALIINANNISICHEMMTILGFHRLRMETKTLSKNFESV